MTAGVRSAARFEGPGKVTIWPLNCQVMTPSDTEEFLVPLSLIFWEAGTFIVTPYGPDSPADITVVVSEAMVEVWPFECPFMVKKLKATGSDLGTKIWGTW